MYPQEFLNTGPRNVNFAEGCEALHEAEKDLEEMIENIDNLDK